MSALPVGSAGQPPSPRPGNAPTKPPTSPVKWSGEGLTALTDLRNAHHERLKRLAELHCATTASNLVTAENVRQAEKLLETPSPGLFWLALDVASTIFVGVSVNVLTSDKPAIGLGWTLLVLGALLAVAAKLATHLAPYSEWVREKIRVRRS